MEARPWGRAPEGRNQVWVTDWLDAVMATHQTATFGDGTPASHRQRSVHHNVAKGGRAVVGRIPSLRLHDANERIMRQKRRMVDLQCKTEHALAIHACIPRSGRREARPGRE